MKSKENGIQLIYRQDGWSYTQGWTPAAPICLEIMNSFLSLRFFCLYLLFEINLFLLQLQKDLYFNCLYVSLKKHTLGICLSGK